MNAEVASMMAQARALLAQMKDAEAQDCLEQIIHFDPRHAEAHYLLGQLRREGGDLSQAIDSFKRALEGNPSHQEARFNLGTAYADQGRTDAALLELKQVLGIPLDFTGLLPPLESQDLAPGADNSKVLIATSLAPKGIENQREALASWQRAGFDIIAINSREEIDILKPFFPALDFVIADRHAKVQYGKPFVYLDDILASLKSRNYEVSGIVNADIHFSSEHLAQFVAKEADDAFVYGCRVDVPDISSANGEMYELGFDYFFFDRRYLDVYPSEGFCMGVPWWDFWIVLIPILQGLRVKRLVTPVAYHVAHPVNWDERSWLSLGQVIKRYIGAQAPLSLATRHWYLAYILLLLRSASIPMRFNNK